MSSVSPVFIHVGFANTGTTSLQRNFFAQRDDIFLAGEPYDERGGLFTAIKSIEDFKLDRSRLEQQCQELVYRRSNGRAIVISDENLCDTPELYFGPYAVPRDTVALRLRHFFPSAKIIFTLRDQRQYAVSAYFNLKRNSAFFDGVSIPPFATWLDAMLSRARAQFLQNLNFLDAVDLYSALFGRENVCLLPLEMLIADGAAAYLRRLCGFMGLPFSPADAARYGEIRNARMSERQALLGELLADDRGRRLYDNLAEQMTPTELDDFLAAGPRASAEMPAREEERIRRRVGLGNWLLAREFGLDLARYGYLLAADNDFTGRQLSAAQRELAFRADIEGLSCDADAKEKVALRLAVELARLRELEMELMTVRRSPVWRTVERLDRIRRRLRGSASPPSCPPS